jgi:GTP cyclohydrolase II
MLYQLGWSTLPGLRGLACSDFRATPTMQPDNERGVVIELATEAQRDDLLRKLEAHFAAQRFTNAADAFDTVKAVALDYSVRQ